MELLEKKIQELLAAYTGRYGIVILDPSRQERLEINPTMKFPAASMIKVPIMYEIMCQAAAGRIDLDEILTVKSSQLVGGAGILQELRPNITMTIKELVTLMIILSDNTATNLLIDLISMDTVNHRMAKLGLTATVLRRKMMDFEAAQLGQENETCAADLLHLFEIIEKGLHLPEEYGALMIDILKRQQVRDKLPFYLPEDTILAHKTGTLPKAEHDGGILFLPHGSYLISILTADLKENYEGLQLVASLGRIIYEHFMIRGKYHVS